MTNSSAERRDAFHLYEYTQMVNLHPFRIKRIIITKIDEQEAYYYKVQFDYSELVGSEQHGRTSKNDVVLVSNYSAALVRQILMLDDEIEKAWADRKAIWDKLNKYTIEECENKVGKGNLDMFARGEAPEKKELTAPSRQEALKDEEE